MKYWKQFSSFSLTLIIALSLSSCLKDECESTRYYSIWEPVFMTAEEIRQDITIQAPQELQSPGKIYYYQDYLLINERGKGIHILDNSNPASPIALSFIAIPGNNDMAVRNNLLYADNYIDLITLNISNPQNPVYLTRTEDVFPAHRFEEERGYVVDYVETGQVEKVPCDRYDDDIAFENEFVLIDNSMAGNPAFDPLSSIVNTTGVGGSMARFAIMGPYLYAIDNYSMDLFDLSNATQPALAGTVDIGWGIETIFPYNDYLFIGSMSGMFIMDNTDPLNPTQVGVFQHAQACDPVFVDGNIAYVTLRDGNECQNFINQLDVVDVTDVTNPELLATYQMHNPHGLSVAKDHLYICENDQGLKVFDASEWQKIAERMVAHVKGFQAYDIIALGNKNLAMVIGSDGLYQFDITDPAAPKELSVLSKSN
ncbi:MAG: hypothetical protein AAF798_20110 [Bacteroidota bacterium]